MIKRVKVTDLKLSDNNPRFIRDDRFKKLVASIKEFPEMLEKRPIIIDENNVILGGNMRYRACLDLKIKEIPVIVADNWSQEQKDKFQIKDNISFGEWDFEVLANNFEVKDLIDWGIDSYNFGSKEFVHDILGMDDDEEEEETGNLVKIADPKITDNGFTKFEVIIPEENKRMIIDVLDKVKEKHQVSQGEAFIKVFKAYKF